MRTEQSPDDFDRIADEVKKAAHTLRRVAKRMRTNEIDSLSIHSTRQLNRVIPSLLAWSDKIATALAIERGRRFRDGE